MACFLVPTTEAIVTTIAANAAKKHEDGKPQDSAKIPLSQKLGWLNKMLWGGSGLLAFEHLWHGEISPVFPFLTAVSDPADTAAMLHEMATSGVAMAVLVTAVWGVMCLTADQLRKRNIDQIPIAAKGASE